MDHEIPTTNSGIYTFDILDHELYIIVIDHNLIFLVYFKRQQKFDSLQRWKINQETITADLFPYLPKRFLWSRKSIHACSEDL